MKKRIIAILMMISMVTLCLTSCSQVYTVNNNLSVEANNFNLYRRLVVINMRSDNLILEVCGNFSVTNNIANELQVTIETGEGTYLKHLVYLNDWTMYYVEDLSGAQVSKYKYYINVLPEAIVPFEFTTIE